VPADFRNTTTDKVHEFLQKAAKPGSFRTDLETLPQKALSELLWKQYGVKVPPGDIPKERTVPSPDVCTALIRQFGLRNQQSRARFDCPSSQLAPLILVVAYAMPLVATVEAEVAAAG
jgi:hypothetical protein